MCQESLRTLCCLANKGPGSFTGTVCSETMYRTCHFGDHSCRSLPHSCTRPVLRPPRRPNVAGTLVQSLLRRLSDLLRCLTGLLIERTPDHAPPARKRAATTVTSPDDTSAGVPAVTLEQRHLYVADYSAPLAPVVGSMFPDWPRPTRPVSLPLPRFAVPTLITCHRLMPSRSLPSFRNTRPVGSQSSTPSPPPYVLMESLGVAVVVPPAELACRGPAYSAQSPWVTEVAPVVSTAIAESCPTGFWHGYGGLGSLVCNVPEIGRCAAPHSPITPSLPASSSARTLPGEEAESFDSATSMSITDRTAKLQLLSPPLVSLPQSIQVQTEPALLLQLTTQLPQPPPVPVADSPPLPRGTV